MVGVNQRCRQFKSYDLDKPVIVVVSNNCTQLWKKIYVVPKAPSWVTAWHRGLWPPVVFTRLSNNRSSSYLGFLVTVKDRYIKVCRTEKGSKKRPFYVLFLWMQGYKYRRLLPKSPIFITFLRSTGIKTENHSQNSAINCTFLGSKGESQLH